MRPGFTFMAADELAKSDSILKERVVLVPQQLEMPALARQFIERVLKRSGEVLAEEPVLGLSPKRILLSSRKSCSSIRFYPTCLHLKMHQ